MEFIIVLFIHNDNLLVVPHIEFEIIIGDQTKTFNMIAYMFPMC